MLPSSHSLGEIQRRIDEVKRFLSVTLSIANAHTVEFYTHDVWNRFIAVSPGEVLRAVSSYGDQQREPQHKDKGPLLQKQIAKYVFRNILHVAKRATLCFPGYSKSNLIYFRGVTVVRFIYKKVLNQKNKTMLCIVFKARGFAAFPFIKMVLN